MSPLAEDLPLAIKARKAQKTLDDLPRFELPPAANGRHGGDEEPRPKLLLLPHEFPRPTRPKLVAGVVGHGMEALVYGNYEAGKTFFGVDLGWRCHVNGRCFVVGAVRLPVRA